VSNVWSTIRGYFFWTYDRGSVHYDVMVTLILAFIFLAPLWINFKDKPPEHPPHPTEVVAKSDGEGGFIYQVDASEVKGTDEASIRESLLRVIEPFAGEVVMLGKPEPVYDRAGHLVSYKVRVRR
jgi:hypothetical protein